MWGGGDRIYFHGNERNADFCFGSGCARRRDKNGRFYIFNAKYDDQKRDNKKIIELCEKMDARISKVEENDKIQIDTLLDSVRAQLREIHCRVLALGVVNDHDWEVWHLLFSRYKSLGGNARAIAWNEDMIRVRATKADKGESNE